MEDEPGHVVAVCRKAGHDFSKQPVDTIRLIAGEGVEGDAHRGVKDKHRYHVRFNPGKPNLRQVHLIHAELFDELSEMGFDVGIGDLGENIATEDIDLLSLPQGTILAIGESAEVELTGLRAPCVQIERFCKGLLAAVQDKAADGKTIDKVGVMAIVLKSGEISPGDEIVVTLPPLPHVKLERV